MDTLHNKRRFAGGVQSSQLGCARWRCSAKLSTELRWSLHGGLPCVGHSHDLRRYAIVISREATEALNSLHT